MLISICRRTFLVGALTLSTFFASGSFAIAASNPEADPRFQPVDAVIEQSIEGHEIPGAVLLVAHDGKVIYRKAYGSRSLEPQREAMTMDTIFDIASLTKVVATATSVMKLEELGQIRLNDPIAKYIPEFGLNGKSDITIRQLLTHFSGLRPDLDLKPAWNGRETAFRMISGEKPATAPGAEFVYSDINYEMLGFLVEKISGMPLEQYAAANIFDPLEMKKTRYLPPADWITKIAPTEQVDGVMLRGVVHDPTARMMGGVAGHAGVFSTADDLARFAQAFLDRKKILSPLAIEKMTTPQQPPWSPNLRGLGWDIDSPFSSNRGELLPVGSFGHTGYTGTSMWIDPYTRTYVILLTNGVHPHGNRPGGPTVALRTKVMNAVVGALKPELKNDDAQRLLSITGYNETLAGSRRPVDRNARVLNGIDVLEAGGFAQLRRNRAVTTVGLLTNQTGLDMGGHRTIDLLAHADGIKLAALFSPEHGALGALDTTNVGNSTDAATGIPIYSVYGATDAARHPPEDVLKKLDAIVIDIQDVGARFYTYETTTGYFLEAAARTGVEVFVLDRPNPITGTIVQGPVSSTPEKFVNYHPLPPRHGMTLGELTQLFDGERKINAKLTVIPMQGWVRGDWFDATNQLWVNPSPNLRDMNQATLYTGIALIEGTNVSVGRGTDTPFEVVGGPWITGNGLHDLAEYLNRRQIEGVRFVPITFTPVASAKFGGQLCGGVNIIVTDRIALDAPHLGVELASALVKTFPHDYKPEKMIELVGSKATFDAIVAGEDPNRIAEDWRADLEKFKQIRSKYLIYK